MENEYISDEMEIEGNILAKCHDTKSDVVIVVDGITEIGSFAFKECQAKEIVLPDSVKTIQQFAFAGCRNLEKIILGKGLERCDDDIIMGSPIQEIVWTKPIIFTIRTDFFSLLYGVICEEKSWYYPVKEFNTFKEFLKTGKAQGTFLLTYKEKSIRLPRYISRYSDITPISDTIHDCLIGEKDMSSEYCDILNCLYDFQNRLNVAAEWHVLDHVKSMMRYFEKNATMIISKITQDSDDEALSLFIKLGLLHDNALRRALQMASEKNMQISVAYILEQMKERGIANSQTEMVL